MKKHFKVVDNDKSLIIECFTLPTFDLGIEIDFDDVDHPTVEKQTKMLLEILEKHWPRE